MVHSRPEIHVECVGVTKRFGGTVALDAVDLEVVTGTVHAIVGENGAGKSTIGKVIAGVIGPDDGQVLVRGQPVRLNSPLAALGHGITMVAQELSLVPSRSVLDNVFLGQESHWGPFVDQSRSRDRFDDLVNEYGISLPPDVAVSRLSVAQQQKVEILRALARSAEVLVLDEPTARLTSEEALTLRQTVRLLADRGVTVIYVSHFLEEVLAIADQITIMRDGRIIRTGPVGSETHETLVEGIIGRSLDATFPAITSPRPDSQPVLELNGLSRSGAFEDITFSVRAGEIVTLAGLVGSGRTEVLRAVFGADRTTSGSMKLDGVMFAPRTPRDAIRHGVAMIPEARRSDGLIPRRSVCENVSLPHLGIFVGAAGLVRTSQERAAATRAADGVGITGATIDSTMDELSGGNQQKSLFARWLMSEPRLFLADEPTRGVDVGAKRGIYDILARLAARGMAVLVVSSELEEVLGLAHRILVMRSGRIVGELEGHSASESDVMELAFGVEEI